MKKNLIAAGAMLLALMSTAHAAVTSSGPVARIYPNDGSTVYFRVAGDSCIGPTAYYSFLMTQPNAKNWYSILMLSMATGKPIIVSVDACETGVNKDIRYVYIDQ